MRWRPAEVGAGLIVSAAVGSVLWALTAVFVAEPYGADACVGRARGGSADDFRTEFRWLPLQSRCESDRLDFALTSPIVTLLWSIAALVLMAVAALGVALLAYGLIRWSVPRHR
ncbi:MAG: hypothetical protein WKF57_19845 [Nakamurella sp.]